MARSSSKPHVTAALLDDERAAVRSLTCPMCHTPARLTQNAIAGWRCVRCGQRWDATRVSAVAAYAAWVVERAAVGTTGGRRPSLSHNVPTERHGGEARGWSRLALETRR